MFKKIIVISLIILIASIPITSAVSAEICGPAYIESVGKGLHLGRNTKLIRVDSTILPGFFPRYPAAMWFIFCGYNDENASTKITTIKDNKTFYVNGSHSVFVGIFMSRFLMNLKMLPFDLPITKYQGRMFWYFNMSASSPLMTGIKYITCLSMIYFWFLAWPFKIKTQLIGFVEPLVFRGYTPFVIWSNSTIL